MKTILVAVVIGLLTIGVSVWLLADNNQSYESETEQDRSISLGETFAARNYDFTPRTFSCDNYKLKTDAELYGCELRFDLLNTSSFSYRVELDGDEAIAESGKRFESNEELSRELLQNDALDRDIEVDEQVEIRSFFEVDAGEQIETIEVYEYANTDPILVEL